MSRDYATAKREYQKSMIRGLVFIAVVITMGGIVLWYLYVFGNPERTFWETVDANLRIKSYSRIISQEQPDSTATNITTVQFNDNIARDTGMFSMQGGQNLNQVTESIGTKDENFFAYRRVEGDIKNSAGEQVDTSSVIGLYGVLDLNSPEAFGLPQTYKNALAGPQLTIPFANLNRDNRRELVQFIKDNNVYKVDFDNVSKNMVNGKTAYKYSVTIDIEQYIRMLQKLDEMNGTELLAGINPEEARGQEVVVFMSIDINARQLLELEVSGQGTNEIITGYNGNYGIEKPEEFIQFKELNNRIQQLLQ